MKICVNRFIGNCPECKRDYNLNHHPNNYDCPGYKEMNLRVFNVNGKGLKKIKNIEEEFDF